MSVVLVGALLAGAIAFLVVLTELVTSKYPRTLFLIARSPYLYAYGFIYGLIAALVYALLPQVTDSIGISNPWLKALAVGFAIKALLHIRLFSVPTGPEKSFPVGIESAVQLFEPWLLKSIDLDEYGRERAFIEGRVAKYADLEASRKRALENIPGGFEKDEKAAMQADLQQVASAKDVLGTYLKYTGRRIFNATFPP